ncbi:MAG: CoA-binding protein [Chlorobiales bacterium]|nr:CoA-binding protein [Chlorobiales bacterium]
MTAKSTVTDFLSQQKLALVGVSRTGKKFGNAIRKELAGKGYQLFLVNPNVQSIDGQPCYPSLSNLPEKVGGVVIVVPPAQTETVVKEAAKAGIKRVWMQQGSESDAAIRFCNDNKMSVVHGECVLMFAKDPKFPHNAHRWIAGALGKLPK